MFLFIDAIFLAFTSNLQHVLVLFTLFRSTCIYMNIVLRLNCHHGLHIVGSSNDSALLSKHSTTSKYYISYRLNIKIDIFQKETLNFCGFNFLKHTSIHSKFMKFIKIYY